MSKILDEETKLVTKYFKVPEENNAFFYLVILYP